VVASVRERRPVLVWPPGRRAAGRGARSGARRRTLLSLACLVAVVGAAIRADSAIALPGDLDPTFGGDGAVVTDFGALESALGVVLQSDGKIIAGGYTGFPASNFAVARYNADGSPDMGFDGDGQVETGFGADDEVRGIALQPDGKPVAAGFTTAGPNPNNFALFRYEDGGPPDTAFDDDGSLFSDFGTSEQARAVAVQPDGKIVVGGSNGSDFIAARYNEDGSPDNSFAGDGSVIAGFGGMDPGLALALQPDGKIVMAGATDTGPSPDNFALIRFDEDGDLDDSFDGDGFLRTDFGGSDRAGSLAIQPDGKILAAGSTDFGPNPSNLALARYNEDGSPDLGFGTGGRVVTDFGSNEDANDIAIQSDGKIVVGDGADSNLGLTRYNPNGSIDQGFAGDGRTEADLGGGERVLGLAIQPDGKILAVGDSNRGPNPPNFLLARFEGGDPPEPPGPGPGPGPDGGPTCRGKDVTISAAPGQVTRGTAAADVIAGTPRRDRIRARRGKDVICAGRGPDRVGGGPGGDLAIGGAGKDRLAGGPARDELRGMKGNDRLSGGRGRDLLVGGKGRSDRCAGGPGSDRTRTC
jgi:uncharacterized delta-60 repeat protein